LYRRLDGTRAALSLQVIVHSSMEMGMLIITGFFLHEAIILAVKRVEFVSERCYKQYVLICNLFSEAI
jgi:hypothetical protein